jgi:hypothetical protein
VYSLKEEVKANASEEQLDSFLAFVGWARFKVTSYLTVAEYVARNGRFEKSYEILDVMFDNIVKTAASRESIDPVAARDNVFTEAGIGESTADILKRGNTLDSYGINDFQKWLRRPDRPLQTDSKYSVNGGLSKKDKSIVSNSFQVTDLEVEAEATDKNSDNADTDDEQPNGAIGGMTLKKSFHPSCFILIFFKL